MKIVKYTLAVAVIGVCCLFLQPGQQTVSHADEQYMPLREFASREELEDWVSRNSTIHVSFDSKGTLDLTRLKPDSQFDCDDYAREFQRKAARDGYYLSVQLVRDGKLFNRQVTNSYELHMGNLALIGNDVWYVEPQTGKITWVCNLD